MIAISCLTLFLVYCFVLVDVSSAAQNLQTHCAGSEIMETVRWNDPAKQLLTFGDFSDTGNTDPPKLTQGTHRLYITCLTTLVTIDPDSAHNNPKCNPKGPIPYRLFVKAEHQRQGSVASTWDLEDVVGGSVDQLLYSSPGHTRFTLNFRNEHREHCDMRFFYIIEYEFVIESTDDVTNPLPGLVEVSPQNIYAGKQVTFTFDVLDRTDTTDEVRVIPNTYQCNMSAFLPASLAEPMQQGGISKETHGDDITKSVWNHVFQSSGTFKICFRHGVLFEKTAEVTVFGENPQYFVVAESIILVGVPVLFRFYGTNLDTRANGDEAKMVLMKYTCEGPASDGALPTHDMGPDDTANATVSVYNVTFLIAGRYRVCYRRRGRAWGEVPDLDDLPDDVSKPLVTPPPGQWSMPPRPPMGSMPPWNGGGMPPHPSPRQTCSPAPQRISPSYQTLLQYKIRGTEVPSDFAYTISKLICVEPENNTIIDDIHKGDSYAYVKLYVKDCDSWDLTCTYDARDRMNYAIYDWSLNPQKYPNVIDLEEVRRGLLIIESDGGVRVVDDSSSNWTPGHVVLIVALVCGVLIAMAVAGIVYMGRLGYATPMQAIRNMWATSHDTSAFEDGEAVEIEDRK
eukprot:PhF_6_TR24760/c0_g1_i2/m.33956